VESLGNKLKTVRESKGFSCDQISREINISTRYLEALETENFSVFPGEPYVLGFLRNYGEYLDLDVNELFSFYRSLKIQEQPMPVEELLKSPSPLPKILLIAAVILVVLALAGGGVWFFLHRPPKTPVEAAARQAAEYTMNTDSLERRFYRGDSILIPLGSDTYKLELTALGDAVTITTPGGPVRLDLSQEVTVDLDSDGFGELRIVAADFVKNDSATGALLRFELEGVSALAAGVNPAVAAVLPADALNAGNAGLSATTVVFSSPGAYPFTLQSVFQSYCLFRWEILFERDRPGRNEQYFQRSNELSIPAQNGIRLWVSNAQAVKLQVIGGGRTVPLELGGAGEVVVADLRWVRDEENRYRLILARLE
jgi:transcriptional regulator with XRE-family HTH domain